MIITDRDIIKLHLYHPSSSLVISNPSPKFAVVFEITISDHINDLTSSIKSVLGFESFQASPIRGIILPQDSQLIKITANVPSSSQYHNQKKIKKKKLPAQFEVAQLNMACSHLLEYNKQKLTREQQTNGRALFGVENIQKSEHYKIKVVVETERSSEVLISQLNELKNSNQNQNNHVQFAESKRNTLVQEFKKHIEPITIKNIRPHVRESQEKQEVNFENSKLNQDFNFAMNKLTLSQLQKIKSSQNNKKQHMPDFPQSNIHIQLPSDKEWKNHIKSKKAVNVDESMVLETFRPAPSMYKQFQAQNGNNRSMELLVLAIISAIFVSLGSNFREIFFSQ